MIFTSIAHGNCHQSSIFHQANKHSLNESNLCHNDLHTGFSPKNKYVCIYLTSVIPYAPSFATTLTTFVISYAPCHYYISDTPRRYTTPYTSATTPSFWERIFAHFDIHLFCISHALPLPHFRHNVALPWIFRAEKQNK